MLCVFLGRLRTRVLAKQSTTDAVLIRLGTMHGNTLSPIVFLLVINPFIFIMHSTMSSYQCDDAHTYACCSMAVYAMTLPNCSLASPAQGGKGHQHACGAFCSQWSYMLCGRAHVSVPFKMQLSATSFDIPSCRKNQFNLPLYWRGCLETNLAKQKYL